MAAGISLQLPSAQRQAMRDGLEQAGRRVTAEAVDKPFVHVAGYRRDQVGWDGAGEQTPI
jgi:hypothetical protein